SADVMLGFSTPLTATVRVTASASVATIPAFELEVGQNASAALQTHLVVNSTFTARSEEHTSELQSRVDLVCRLLLEKKKSLYKKDTCDSSRKKVTIPERWRLHKR